MVQQDAASPMARIQEMLLPWQTSLKNPAQAQEGVLKELLDIYAQTGYGQKYGVASVGSIEDYRAQLPIATYDDYQPVIRRVMGGETELLLNEPILGWAITRGTT